MRSYIACTLALIAAAFSQVSATAVTCSNTASSCGDKLTLTTYTNGHYVVKGSEFFNVAGANGKAQLVNEGGKFYLKADGKYFCDSKTEWHGGYRVTPCTSAAKECEVEVRACDKYTDRLKEEPPKPNCISFFFTNTGHYLSAGLTDSSSQGVQSQTWCRTWEYHYADCGTSPVPPPPQPSPETPVTCSNTASKCGDKLSLTTYTNGHYALKGSEFVNVAGANGKAQLVSEGGKFYLKADGKYFCDSKTEWHGGYRVTSCTSAAKDCEVEVRACDKYTDRLKEEPPKPNCISFFFTNTGHYLSAGLTDSLSQGVQSQTWCRTWEYHYATCPSY